MNIITSNNLVGSVYDILSQIDIIVQNQKDIAIEEKGYADFVTSVDLEIEQLLVQKLRKIVDVPCLTEESDNSVDCDSYWVIDPIDGTTNFIHGYPSYCISIALVQNGITEYGFVYNLATKELFVGIKDQGAHVIDTHTFTHKLVSPSNTQYIADSLIGFGCPYDKGKVPKLFNICANVLKECHDLKRNGPASLDICYVASGRLDAYFEFDLKEWDYKAAKLILEESGGVLTDWNGNDIKSGMSNVVASNGKIHKQLLQYLA